MSSFSQWFVAYQKNQTIKQITWLCGSETVLVDDIVETIASHFSSEPWCRSSFVAGTDDERAIWADIDQHSLDGRTPRLVIVRQAQNLKNLDRIAKVVNTRNANSTTSVVFVADTPELEREPLPPEAKKERKALPLLPHLAAIQGKGWLIECKPFTQATAKHAVAWVQTKVDIRKGVAGKLLERANGDLRLTRDAIRKLSVFPDEITEQTINLLFSARPRMSFVDALLELDKPAALLALKYLPRAEYSSTIGLLDQRVELLGTVRDLVMAHHTPGQVATALGTMGFLARDLVPISKSYDQKRRTAARRLLAKTDEALRLGVTEGPLESLVHFW